MNNICFLSLLFTAYLCESAWEKTLTMASTAVSNNCGLCRDWKTWVTTLSASNRGIPNSTQLEKHFNACSYTSGGLVGSMRLCSSFITVKVIKYYISIIYTVIQPTVKIDNIHKLYSTANVYLYSWVNTNLFISKRLRNI